MITYGHVDGIDGRVYYLINDQYNDSIEDLLNGKSDYFVVDGSIGREKIEKFIKENIRKVKKIIKENAMKIAHKVKRKTTLEKQNANKEKGKKYLENIITKKQQNQLKEDIAVEKIDIQEEPIDTNKTFECPNCHAMNYEDSAFCEKCARILKYEEETSNERKY